eukprot:TRINITY_DN254_c0_g2_i25.p5 TRINITY_DN254_c0_g2~~TRINITY_DN254_c0_g2_i25.p5  ORF type:complete len:126 (-),score=9.41 TRINITY_DN254_c0_g2_i25:2802-3179(-)
MCQNHVVTNLKRRVLSWIVMRLHTDGSFGEDEFKVAHWIVDVVESGADDLPKDRYAELKTYDVTYFQDLRHRTFYDALRRQRIRVVMQNEFRTSKVCSRCHQEFGKQRFHAILSCHTANGIVHNQ